jgi:hypothetical protein
LDAQKSTQAGEAAHIAKEARELELHPSELLDIIGLGWLIVHCGFCVLFGATGMPLFILTGVIGLLLVPFSVIVLLVASVLQRGRLSLRRAAFRALLLLFVAGFVLFLVLGPAWGISYFEDIGTRLRVAYSSDLDELQDWAEVIIAMPDEELTEEKRGVIEIDNPPDFVKQLGARYVYVSGQTPEQRHVTITWGGGFHHWGILIGGPAFKACSDSSRWVFRWRAGVYGHRDRQ